MGLCLTQEEIIQSKIQFLARIGKGTFGKVHKIKINESGQIFAMKIIAKYKIITKRLLTNIIN